MNSIQRSSSGASLAQICPHRKPWHAEARGSAPASESRSERRRWVSTASEMRLECVRRVTFCRAITRRFKCAASAREHAFWAQLTAPEAGSILARRFDPGALGMVDGKRENLDLGALEARVDELIRTVDTL